jgi:hypothetical protein
VTLPPAQALQGWFDGAKLVTLSSGTIRTLRIVSARDGQSRVLFQTNDVMLSPAWSPDGKTVSVLHALGDQCEVRNMNVDGSPQDVVTLPDRGCGGSLTWTSDKRSLLYMQFFPPNRRPVIMKLDVATKEATHLYDAPTGGLNWILDGDTVIASESAAPAGQTRSVIFRRIDLDGTSTLLREVPLTDSPSFGAPVSASSAFIGRSNPPSLSFIRLDRSDMDRSFAPSQSPSFLARPAISADKQWVAFPLMPSGTDPQMKTSIELVRLDGSVRQRVEVPFFVQFQDGLAVLPGATQVVATERPSSNKDSGVYLVDVTARSVRKLFDYAPAGRLPDFAVSPDGANVLVTASEPLPAVIAAVDLSRIK